MRAKVEIAVGMPMTSPENVSLPPKRSAYKLDDGTIMKKDIWCLNLTVGPLSWRNTQSYLYKYVRHEHYNQRARSG